MDKTFQHMVSTESDWMLPFHLRGETKYAWKTWNNMYYGFTPCSNYVFNCLSVVLLGEEEPLQCYSQSIAVIWDTCGHLWGKVPVLWRYLVQLLWWCPTSNYSLTYCQNISEPLRGNNFSCLYIQTSSSEAYRKIRKNHGNVTSLIWPTWLNKWGSIGTIYT